MYRTKRVEAFEKLVNNRFEVFNSLFLNLPYREDDQIGILIPVLFNRCSQGLASGLDPQEILDTFFANYTDITSEKDKIDFMFRVIQYVERQVVLYDSVEDAAFPRLKELGNNLSVRDFFQSIDKERTRETIVRKLSDFSARIVFTAHPTQFYPPSVLDIISRLRTLIPKNEINEIDQTLQQLGLTSLINSKKPTPFDEARNIIYFLRNVYYEAVGELYTYIKESLGNVDFDNTDIIKLGFWPGGDRDGNPFVTDETTRKVADELRMTLMKCYYQDIKKLQRLLTFREVEEVLNDLQNRLYNSMFDPDEILNLDEIISPLIKARKLLVNNYHSLYLENIDSLIDKVRIFKTHFASLDIRQDHSIHKKAIEAILIDNKLISSHADELRHGELVQILLHQNLEINIDAFEDEVVKDTIRNIMQLKTIQDRNGEEGCNRYIISNSEDIFAVLFVYALFRWSGWDGSKISFDIVPLFETMEGMHGSEGTMQELFSIPEYRAHVAQRNNKQTIMLGFSDGTKDGGYLKANWAIFKTKEQLSAICESNHIKAIFFDGRGGPPARGGGKTHRFYAAQSPLIANHEIQLTIQGQTITSKYATKKQFIHNCEQLLTAGLSNSIAGNKNAVSSASRQLLEELAKLSFEKYTALKNHPLFIPYLEQRSTLKYYGKANIGSRPAKRGKKETLELSDLRAISFVGSWSQLKQNVPGYFGLGTAIQTLVNKGKEEELNHLFREVPFVKALALNSMMSLKKCNFNLTSYMQKDAIFGDFWNILNDEYELSKAMLLKVSDFNTLMQEEPISRESIRIRERIVLPLLVIQQYALQKISREDGFKELYEKIVTRSLYGNINASRNSA